MGWRRDRLSGLDVADDLGLGPDETARRPRREDPGKIVTDVLLLSASVTSLVAVGVVLLQAGKSHGATKDLLITLGIISVVLAWAVVHAVFAFRAEPAFPFTNGRPQERCARGIWEGARP
jgi:uncharacterized membrane protein